LCSPFIIPKLSSACFVMRTVTSVLKIDNKRP
jgi:hypothetical protein